MTTELVAPDGATPILPIQVTFVTLGEQLDAATDFSVYTAWFPSKTAAHDYARKKCMSPIHDFKLCYMISETRGLFIPVPVMTQVDAMPNKSEEDKQQDQRDILERLMTQKLHI